MMRSWPLSKDSEKIICGEALETSEKCYDGDRKEKELGRRGSAVEHRPMSEVMV